MNEKDTEYENNNIAYDYQYTKEVDGGIKCKNYELCETVLPKWWFECKGNYLCTNCHMLFGTWGESHTGKGILEISDNLECPICLEKKNEEYHNLIANTHYVLTALKDVIMVKMKKMKNMKMRKILGNVHYVANNRRFKCSKV